eukprot:GILK01005553.1.p1 GENE.GILK01005553.1~~GILK01005553.1.p1  ORF type:complete len:330 (+),score=15.10 GILK01005553.1:30-1019(+)
MEELSPKPDVVQQNGESVEKDYEPVEKTVTEYDDSPRSIEEDRSVFETELRQEENENADDEDEQHWRRRRTEDDEHDDSVVASTDLAGTLKGETEPSLRVACCSKCLKESRTNNRDCLCVVNPRNRKMSLGQNGCRTCRCTGCHPRDKEVERTREPVQDHLKNGCCRACMKAFSDTHRACICQVPSHVRKVALPQEGCKICRCQGCHPNEPRFKAAVDLSRGLLPTTPDAHMLAPVYGIPYRSESYLYGVALKSTSDRVSYSDYREPSPPRDQPRNRPAREADRSYRRRTDFDATMGSDMHEHSREVEYDARGSSYHRRGKDGYDSRRV